MLEADNLMKSQKLVFRVHAIQRMFQRQISEEEVRYIVESGEVIEQYPEDTPFPSKLMMGWSGKKPLHVVVADNIIEAELIIITVYEPTLDKWEPDFKRRKQ